MEQAEPKRPFDIDAALKRIEEAVRPFPKAGLFELQESGFGSVFEQLIACIISIRTFDEAMVPIARTLFARARTPAAMDALTPEQIDAIIHGCTFHAAKARQIHAIAHRVVEAFGGEMPCDEATLLSFAGVGPKCAGLALGIACGQPFIGVDIHVHRITNRWGYVRANTPEATLAALKTTLPKEHWIEINRLLVPFGKHICTGRAPACSTCPVLDMCLQVGVSTHR